LAYAGFSPIANSRKTFLSQGPIGPFAAHSNHVGQNGGIDAA